MADVPAPATF